MHYRLRSSCSLCGMDAHRFRIYSINLQILQAALTNSACVLIPYVAICSFSSIARHTFSVTIKFRDRVRQVVPKILLLVFKSRGNLSTVCRACQGVFTIHRWIIAVETTYYMTQKKTLSLFANRLVQLVQMSPGIPNNYCNNGNCSMFSNFAVYCNWNTSYLAS